MDPRVGRFASIDPHPGSKMKPLTLNDYLYASADPVGKKDPSGQMGIAGVMTINFVIGAAIGGGASYIQGNTGSQIAKDAATGGVLGAILGGLGSRFAAIFTRGASNSISAVAKAGGGGGASAAAGVAGRGVIYSVDDAVAAELVHVGGNGEKILRSMGEVLAGSMPKSLDASRMAVSEAAHKVGLEFPLGRLLDGTYIARVRGEWVVTILKDGATVVQDKVGRVLFLYKP
jgi:hypothetical protein